MASLPAIAVPAALVLAGCATDGTVHHRTIHRSMIEQAVTQIRGDSVNLVVIGNPSARDPGSFELQIADAIEGANPGTAARFIPMPADSAHGHRRIVMLFNGPIGAHGPDLCDAALPSGGAAAPDGKVRVLAAFCATDNRPYSSLAASHAGPADPANPSFRTFLRRIIHGLLPFHDPQSHPDHDRGEFPLAQ
jgi:hypothetical protein